MNYRDYIASILTWAVVTEELNYRGEASDKTIIIKDLPGSNYRDAIVKPIQLEIETDEVTTTKSLMETFAQTYNNTDFTDGLTYVKQYYNTPMVLGNFNMSGNGFTSKIIVSGTLIISENISDIKTVIIDGEIVETQARTLTYTTVPDNQASGMGGLINTTEIRNGMLQFSFNLISKSNSLTHKIRRIIKGEIAVNTTFTVKIIFSDNDDAMSLNMKLNSNSLNSNNQALPVGAIAFIK